MSPRLPIQFCFFQSLDDIHPILQEVSLNSACNYFTPHFPPILAKEDRKTQGKPFSFNIYKPGTTRKKENVKAMTGLVLDFDNKEEFVYIESVLENLDKHHLLYFWYTTWSHTEHLPRWRLIVPFLNPLPVAEWKALYDKMFILLDSPPGIDHAASRDVSRLWCSPCRNAGHPFEANAKREGKFLDATQIDALLSPDQKVRYENQQQPQHQNMTPSHGSSELTRTWSDVMEMLEYVDAGCDYDTWIKIGMALHHYSGGTMQGFSLWETWSRRSTKFPGNPVLLAHWNSFSMKANPVSIATLVHYAKQYGYEMFRQNNLGVISTSSSFAQEKGYESAPVIPLPVETDTQQQTEEEEEEESTALFDFSEYVQKDIFDFPNPFLQEIYNYLLGSASYLNPLYALSSTIVAGGFLRRKINTGMGENDTHTNFMTLSIGPSGTGKTQILKGLQNILVETDQKKHLVPSLGTIQGAIEALKQKGACLFLIQDEASYAFKAMKNKNISIHEMNVEKFKLDMFSNPPFCSPPASKAADMTHIDNPFFCEISSSTPDILKHLSPESYTNGLLPRYLVFRDTTLGRTRNPKRKLLLPQSLKDVLKEYNTASYTYSPAVVFESDADTLLKKFEEKVDEIRQRVLEKEDSHQLALDAILGRVSEHAAKLSLLGAEKQQGRYLVTLHAVQWGISVAIHSFNTFVEMIEEGIYENRVEEMRARVLRAVQNASEGEWVPKRKISHRVKFLTSRELNDCLFKLHEEGAIEIQMRGKAYMYIKSKKRKGKKPS